jgi:hypothetical protein
MVRCDLLKRNVHRTSETSGTHILTWPGQGPFGLPYRQIDQDGDTGASLEDMAGIAAMYAAQTKFSTIVWACSPPVTLELIEKCAKRERETCLCEDD